MQHLHVFMLLDYVLHSICLVTILLQHNYPLMLYGQADQIHLSNYLHHIILLSPYIYHDSVPLLFSIT